jgi:hypothetical protein
MPGSDASKRAPKSKLYGMLLGEAVVTRRELGTALVQRNRRKLESRMWEFTQGVCCVRARVGEASCPYGSGI